jgi:hypothetical protein
MSRTKREQTIVAAHLSPRDYRLLVEVVDRTGTTRSALVREAVGRHLDALVGGAAYADPVSGRVDDRAAHDAVRDRAANQPGGPTHTPTRVERRDPGAPPRVG